LTIDVKLASSDSFFHSLISKYTIAKMRQSYICGGRIARDEAKASWENLLLVEKRTSSGEHRA